MKSQVLIQTFSPCEISMSNCAPGPVNRLRIQHLRLNIISSSLKDQTMTELLEVGLPPSLLLSIFWCTVEVWKFTCSLTKELEFFTPWLKGWPLVNVYLWVLLAVYQQDQMILSSPNTCQNAISLLKLFTSWKSFTFRKCETFLPKTL